jgi:GTPase
VNPQVLAEQIKAGHRRAIARGLTLVESLQPVHEKLSLELFGALGAAPRAYRLGITGPPGAGKSTLIEQIVLSWIGDGDKVAVLTIDPSSQRTGGSLLGDKTRMGEIADRPEVFIRPSPTGEHLGGLGRRTPLMCALLERAGFKRIVVETVGVGQSEISASYLVDRLLLVALPGAGDEVQGLKRGLMEEVDLVAVNKADLGQAKTTVAILRSALRVFRRDVPVFEVSALEGTGLESLLAAIDQPLESEVHERARGELHFFDQYFVESVKRLLLAEGTHWGGLRKKVSRGEVDFLQALPELCTQLENLSNVLLTHLEE